MSDHVSNEYRSREARIAAERAVDERNRETKAQNLSAQQSAAFARSLAKKPAVPGTGQESAPKEGTRAGSGEAASGGEGASTGPGLFEQLMGGAPLPTRIARQSPGQRGGTGQGFSGSGSAGANPMNVLEAKKEQGQKPPQGLVETKGQVPTVGGSGQERGASEGEQGKAPARGEEGVRAEPGRTESARSESGKAGRETSEAGRSDRAKGESSEQALAEELMGVVERGNKPVGEKASDADAGTGGGEGGAGGGEPGATAGTPEAPGTLGRIAPTGVLPSFAPLSGAGGTPETPRTDTTSRVKVTEAMIEKLMAAAELIDHTDGSQELKMAMEEGALAGAELAITVSAGRRVSVRVGGAKGPMDREALEELRERLARAGMTVDAVDWG